MRKGDCICVLWKSPEQDQPGKKKKKGYFLQQSNKKWETFDMQQVEEARVGIKQQGTASLYRDVVAI